MAAITTGTHGQDSSGETYFDRTHSIFGVEKGFLGWAGTLDHKRIGIMYFFAVTLAFIGAGIMALLVRIELFSPGRTIMDPDTYNRIFTIHGVVMVFLFIIPAIPAAIGNFILPIMLGAKDVAFPKLNLASFYIYVLGALFAVFSLINGGVDTGWTFYTPYSTTTNSAVVSMTLGAFIMGFSSILTGVNFIVTIHKMRAPGITWSRLPLFIWAQYATSILQVLATPVLAITLLLLALEKTFDLGIFDPHKGGDPVLFQHFFWFYSHPAVYIMILPGMGIINELISTFSHRKIMGYRAVFVSSLTLALLSFLVWAHHMFTSGMSEYANMVFSALTMLVALPSGVKVFNWVGTLRNASISTASPMLYALAFMFQFCIGGLTGLFLAMLATDIHLHDTYFVVAHFHYVMVGSTVFAFFGGVHYWWPKVTGKMYDEKMARRVFWVVFVGYNVTFLSQFVMGSRGMPRRYYDYLPQFEFWHKASTIGSWILAVGLFWMLFMFIRSLQTGKKAPRNPWNSAGYEWMAPTPPPLANFNETPVMTRGPYDYHLATDAELSEN
ncbi:cbb3-type cytochrome c oxidase subunit I [soil metagenome]